MDFFVEDSAKKFIVLYFHPKSSIPLSIREQIVSLSLSRFGDAYCIALESFINSCLNISSSSPNQGLTKRKTPGGLYINSVKVSISYMIFV
jgi:hypothetical protein